MSKAVCVQVFYGSEEVRYGPKGVDLSNFISIMKNVCRATNRTWGSITKWLYKTFSLDSEQHVLSVMTLTNRSETLFWELMPLQGTGNWILSWSEDGPSLGPDLRTEQDPEFKESFQP
jgi:hypothetical protein